MSEKSAPIVAIVGRTNVGKSSLFNAILSRREAIVAREPGTTRDKVTAKASHGRKDFWLVDTAGLKEAEDDFELDIEDQIVQAADLSDLIVVVVEANISITEEDRRVAKLALKSKKHVLLAVNKIDKNPRADMAEWRRLGIKDTVAVSTSQRKGIIELLDLIAKKIPSSKIKEDKNKIRVSLLGRPNVGKSSLFNSLSGQDLAIVAAASGTTRDINRISLRRGTKEIEIIDTAGIRKKSRVAPGVEQFSMLRSLRAIEESDISLLLMDEGELNVQFDQKLAGMIKEAGNGLILVVTKWDIAKEKAAEQDLVAQQISFHYPFVPWAPLIFTSAKTGQNVEKILGLVVEVETNRKQKFRTPELNRWLREVSDQHPPAGLKNRTPNLTYMVQEEDISYPSFKIFGADSRFLHWSYKRYLERKFRERWPLTGAPLKFWFIDKNAGVKK